MLSSGNPTKPKMSSIAGAAAVAEPQPAPPAAKSLYGSYAPTAHPYNDAPRMP